MGRTRIGVDVDDFRLAPKQALRKAADMHFGSVELATVAGELAPSNLSGSGRRHLAKYVEGLGLSLAALVADLPGLRLTDARTVDERVARTCEVLELAAAMHVPIVTASSGALTHPDTGEVSPAAVEALSRIGERADACGTVYALRPSFDNGERLVAVTRSVGCPSIRVGLDPAAMVMHGANPMSVIERLADQVSLVHVRDGTIGGGERAGTEARFGEGDVDMPGLIDMLRDVDYRGPYLVRRCDSQSPVADIEHARDQLRRIMHVEEPERTR